MAAGGRLVRRAEAGARLQGVDGDGGGWTSRSERGPRGGCGRCPYARVTVAASERGGGGGEGGASAVEAGQSCSRHQGRHFLWGERERERDKADIKKCVVAGPTLTICHGGPMVGSQCMLIIAMGIKGASSLEIAPLKLQTPIHVHTEKDRENLRFTQK